MAITTRNERASVIGLGYNYSAPLPHPDGTVNKEDRYSLIWLVGTEPNILLAESVESSSDVSTPAVGQIHAILANDAESASEVSQPAIGQEHGLLAEDVESASELSSPDIGQVHALLADDVESESELSGPAVGQTHGILANDVESSSEVSTPAVGQVHALLADDVESASEVSNPALSAPIQRKGLGSRKRKRLYVKNGRIVEEREFYTPSIPLPEQVAATLEAQSKSQPAVFRKKLKLERKPAKEPELTN